MIYAGFDASQFPGEATMQWLKENTNLRWCGFYLGPAPSHHDAGWMTHRATLEGWGLAPVYVGQELAGPGSHLVSPAQGAIDGGEAARLMRTAGFQQGSVCFLDLEDGAPFVEPRVGYVVAWALALQGATVQGHPSGFHAGIYCSHAIAQAVHQALITVGVESPDMWVFRVKTTDKHVVVGRSFSEEDPGVGSGYGPAYLWQCEQNAVIDVAGRPLQVDLSTSLFQNPAGP